MASAASAVTLLATVLLPQAPAFGAARPVKSPTMRFVTTTPTLEQSLEIKRVGKKAASFKLDLVG